MFIIIICLSIVSNIFFVKSSHFTGGTVTWKSVNNSGLSSKSGVIFTQSYQWRRSVLSTYCNQSYVLNQSPLIPTTPGSLTCVTTPLSNCGGYKSVSANGYCTDFSVVLDSSSSQILTIENITMGSKFCVSYQGTSWISLRTTNCGTTGGTLSNATTTLPSCYITNGGWSIGCCVDLSPRLDGIINTPPVVLVISPIRVAVNTITNIQIPVIDADNDVLRCRWARNTSVLNECADVCGSIVGSTLYNNNCTLTFDSTGKTAGDYYAVALMAEDFYTESTTVPFSSIPIQFLIAIIATPLCPLKPIINSNLSTCTPIQIGVTFYFTLTITQGCNGTTINDLFRVPPLNMYKSGITQIGSTNVWTITETWIPTIEQIGSQVYCAIATDSANIQSDQYCTTFTVVSLGNSLNCPFDISSNRTTQTSPSSTSTTATSQSTTSATPSTSIPTTIAMTTSTTETTDSSVLSTTTTSTTTSTSSSSSTATVASSLSTNTNQPVTVAVSVSVLSTSHYRSNSLDLGLGLGLGLPLLLLLTGLALYCCCCKQCQIFSGKNVRRCSKHSRDVHEQNEFRDYREEYINDGDTCPRKYEIISSHETLSLRKDKSIIPMGSSDFEMKITKTSFYSPSVNILPSDDVQYTRNYSSQSACSMQHDSILMRAYSVQENRKTFYSP